VDAGVGGAADEEAGVVVGVAGVWVYAAMMGAEEGSEEKGRETGRETGREEEEEGGRGGRGMTAGAASVRVVERGTTMGVMGLGVMGMMRATAVNKTVMVI
jgi:hypothetical protein